MDFSVHVRVPKDEMRKFLVLLQPFKGSLLEGFGAHFCGIWMHREIFKIGAVTWSGVFDYVDILKNTRANNIVFMTAYSL